MRVRSASIVVSTPVRWGPQRRLAAGSVVLFAISLLAGVDVAASSPVSAAPAAGAGSPVTVAEALAEAERTGEPQIVESMLTEYRTVEVTPSGSFVASEHIRPVRARVGGGWQPIDTTLVKRDGAYVPAASTVDVRVSAGGDGPLVSMSRAGRTLEFSWPDRLPAPVIDGNQAIFASVLPDVDLIVMAEPDGFSHLFRVATAEAAADPRLARLTLGMSAPGLRVEQAADGVLRAVDIAGGGAVFEAPRPIMWDSAGAGDAGVSAESTHEPLDGPPHGATVAEVAVEIGSGEVALVPDQELLAAADTVYPVYVDPVWKTVAESAWTMVSSGYPNTSYWEFGGTEGVGFCDVSWDADCNRDQVKRIMFRFPMTAFSGKYILSAEFVAYNTHSYNCTDDRWVDLWRVNKFYSSTTWSNDGWIRFVEDRWVSYCTETPVEFGGEQVRAEVQSAADNGYNTISFGLKARNETSMAAWKRFTNDAYLRVEYNTPPPQPLQGDLTSDPGGACDYPGTYVRTLPEMQAKLYDPDMESAQKLYAEFAVGWDHDGDGTRTTQWSSGKVGPKTPGSLFTLTVPATLGIPEGSLAYWIVRAWDGYQWSPWSQLGSNQTACYFTLNTSVPAAPSITSTEYPESDPDNPDDPWHDGVGRYGTFTIDTPSDDVTKYWIGLNGNPSVAYERVPATPGGPVTIQLAPGHAGLNYVTAQAFNNAGTNSSIATYHFRVAAGTPAKAHWKLDDPVGSAQVADVTATFPGSVHGGVTLGADGMSGTAMQLNGVDGHAKTTGPVIDTSTSFAVSAWARLPEVKPDHAAIIATQAGTTRSGFELYYSTYFDRWIFNRYDADDTGAAIVRAKSPSAPAGGQWTHLVGVYDAVAQHLRLYVNGEAVATTPYTKPWNATGSVHLGAGWYGSLDSFFDGEIDDVRIFDRIITTEEARELYTQHPVVAARWKLNSDGVQLPAAAAHYKLDEAAGASRAEDVTGTYPAGAHGGVTFGLAGKVGMSAGFNGTDGYLATTGQVVDTTKSFTVSAWVRLPATKPQVAAIIATQAGTTRSGFELYYSAYFNRWIFNRYAADTADADIVRAQSNAVPTTEVWTHLVGVYDAEAAQIKLYVDGTLQQTTAYTTPWSATGRVQVGAGWYGSPGRFFDGGIDDVRVFGEAITDSQAAALALDGTEQLSADDSAIGHHVTLRGGASIDEWGGWVGNPPGGLVLDGVDDYADTTGPVLTTDESFTVTAWVSSAGAPTRDAAVLSQVGDSNAAFTLRYSPAVNGGEGGYQVAMPDADGVNATWQTAEHAENRAGYGWDHLALVYDAFRAEMRLYVNGQLYQVGDNVSWRHNTLAFNAAGGLQIGRTKTDGVWGEYWPGVVDDVWAFRGVLAEEQIQNLARGVEYQTYPGP